MNIESFRAYCLNKKGVTEEFPFGEEVLVFKVMGKLFALTDVESFASINLKVDPEKGAELRETYPAVQPGYHMNKKHWNTVLMDGSLPDKLVRQWIDDSYALVASKLTKSQKSALESM
ncbi:MmcQ/YjbR family DNA-binding protein [Pseudochryseolinea flava]|uniref:MmcQ/YjbR family DNA-binding protein n=1 Tax=Pseudochryseolinea flava TaxID=2059302 RepID=A0A364XWK6_9BACT|nr:MmcQ/YjbR family DNA-binding protein [Pseudochryseolinea flava]RAV98594.1 MmcQ/YjbR family DNA-binding protein [Pseudochryseolinea flava]